ncbi:Kinase [Hexamita inflata]|uniref:Kinase n=1 Tax=Hexamita inflata TaxID=28002 RepID=A0AA86UQV7_9EUKA|nr:Kinase [Hexamita inflata]
MQNYIKLNQIGTGSFADVHKVQNIHSGNHFAMKIIKDNGRETNEQNILKLLQDVPNVPKLIDAFTLEGQQVIVQELIDGLTLYQFVQNIQVQNAPVVPEQGLKIIMRQLLQTVKQCHLKGIAHQDIKMNNIIINRNRAVLIDFGEAHEIQNTPNENIIVNPIFCQPRMKYTTNKSYQQLVQPDLFEEITIYPEKCTKSNEYVFKRMHHLQSLSQNPNTDNLWINAIQRFYEYNKIINKLTKASTDNIMNPQYDNIELIQDNYPSTEDVFKFVAAQVSQPNLQDTNLYTINKKMSADAWSVGMNGFLMILGNGYIKDLGQYQQQAAISILIQAIRNQFEQTLNSISEESFQLFLTQQQDIQVQIVDGPFPKQTPFEIFLLIAGLLHPHPKLRLSVSEALCCPFIVQGQQLEENYDIINLPRGMEYGQLDQITANLNVIKCNNMELYQNDDDKSQQQLQSQQSNYNYDYDEREDSY